MFYVQNISINMNLGLDGGKVHGPPYIFCSLLKKRKKYTSMTYTKRILHHFDYFFFFRMNNKKNTKRGARSRCNWATMSRVAPCDTLTRCGQSPCLWGIKGLCARFFFIINFPTFTFLYFKWLLLVEFSSWNGETNCILFRNNAFTNLFA